MAIVIMQTSNTMQTNVSDENTASSNDIMNGLINNNDKNLMDGIEETSCNNITYNQVRNDSPEKNLEDINFNMDTNTSLTEEGFNDKTKDAQSDILDNQNNKSESNCDNVLQLNNIVETTHNDENSLKSDDENRQVELQSKKYLRIVDSDSEDDDIINSSSRKKVNVIEDDNESVISNKSLKTNNVMKDKNKIRILDSDSKSKSEHSEEIPEFIKKTKRIFQTLVDSESDEDEIHGTGTPLEDTKHTNFKDSNKKITKSKSNKKESNRKGSIRDTKVEAMRKIHSETQRLIRESEISLPYHRPKSRTLQEFLTRKKVSGMLPEAPTTASKLKMSSVIVSQILEDKEKEAEEFYKSSESEEEVETAKIGMNHISESIINNTNTSYIEKNTPSNNIESVPNKNTEKLMNNDTYNNDKISLNSHETSLNNISRKLPNEIANAETEDVSLKENVQDHIETLHKITMEHDSSENIEIDVQKTVDMLLQSVEHETKKNNKDELNENIACNTIISEIHSEGTACEIPKEQNPNIEKQTTHTENKDDHQNTDSSVSEKGSQETKNHIQGLPLPDFIYKEQKNNNNKQKSIKKKLLPAIKSNIEPRLRGNPGMIIDLSCDMKPNKAGVESLLNRFFSKHTTTDKDIEKTTEINVVHVEETHDGPKLVKHAFLHKQPILEQEDPELNKPGAKLKRLQEDLKFKMAMKRNEEWKQKEQELKEQEDQLKEDEELYDICNEEKLCDETSESGESEPEENDIPMLDKRKKPACEFVDDEAMESEEEQEKDDKIDNIDEEEEEEENEEEEEENEEEEEEGEGNYGNNDIDSDESSIKSVTIKKKRKSNRIIKAFEDDSNSSLSNISIGKINEPRKTAFERTATDVDLFETNSNNYQNEWNSDEECNVSIFEKNKQTNTITQTCKTPSIKTSVLDFVSPITQLTILNTNLDSDKKESAKKNESIFASGIDSFSQIYTPLDKTPKSTDTPDRRVGLQKKLFDDFNNVTSDEDLMQLCSGAFPSTQTNDFNPTISMSSRQTSSLDTLNTQMLDINKLDKDILENETSQDLKLFLDDDSTSPTASKTKTKENSSTDDPWSTLFTVVPSDDEEDSKNTNKVNLPKKRRVKKLELSDDEEGSADNLQSDEEEADEYLDYDSEENEVIVSKKSIKKVTSEFFEKEAELSESDWDSADEDEKDLDKLEREEGDEDDIDESKVRNQLEKIHMKQVLDQDQREVRMLQELLFEDGDLHSDSSGRQRKFKWKNIDKLGENTDVPSVDDDTNVDLDAQENENELALYKLRHEREKFLEEKRRADVDVEIEEDLEKSEIFKLGVKVLKRIESGQSDKGSSQKYDQSIEPIMPRNLSDLLNTVSPGGNGSVLRTIMKKRSFLSRGDQELERIAKRVKLNDTVNLAQVNTKNFVFAHISPVVKNNDDEENENTHGEKENESKDKASRRQKRKATTSMTPTTTKRVKQEGTDTRKKKLF